MRNGYWVSVYVFLRRSIFIIYEIFIHSPQYELDAATGTSTYVVVVGASADNFINELAPVVERNGGNEKNTTILVLFSTRTRTLSAVSDNNLHLNAP